MILREPKATLGNALNNIEHEGRIKLHSSLKEAFIKLYGYTSDAEGIRHTLKVEPNLKLEDALFMLVACSAFVNFLLVKADKAWIKFEEQKKTEILHFVQNDNIN